jgi:L-arabinose isomerase
MNLNQAAHGDREAGFLHTRMRLARKVVAGHWQSESVVSRIGAWARAARAWHDWQGAKFARIGDNMRQVAVTEGDKVSAEMKFGFSVNGYGIGDLVAIQEGIADSEINALCDEYAASYQLAPALAKGGERYASLRDAARIEAALRAFLKQGGFKGFTTTFEDLHGLKQLPGIAVQRLMAEGYGFGAEGDWKTAALLRAMKVIASDLGGPRETVADGVTGWRVPPGDPAALAAAVERVRAFSPAERTGRCDAAQADAVARFTVPAMVAGVVAVLERVVSGRRRRR